MHNPLLHAEQSATRWGGRPEDYLPVRTFFDEPASHLPDDRPRVILPNGFGFALAGQMFGPVVVNSDGRQVPVREIGQLHVLEDLGFVPSLAECLTELPVRRWMSGTRKSDARRHLAGADVEETVIMPAFENIKNDNRTDPDTQ